jgi:hypothetical protein
MAEVDSLDKELGNTKTSSLSKAPQHRRWCWTLYPEKNITVDMVDELSAFLGSVCKKFVFQVEKCPTTGKQHYQGYSEFTNARQMNGVIKVLKMHGKGPHVEPAKGNEDQCYDYCTKEESRDMVGGQGGFPARLKDPLEGVEMYDWQKELIDMIKTEPDKRKIYWIYDTGGNMGKTTLAKHICMKYRKEALYVNGKSADIQCGIAKHINDGKDLKVAIFGYPRSAEQFVSYGALEVVKDGIFYNGKYESGMVMYNIPHVIVLANFPPDQTKLSGDRWVIKDISSPIAETF